MKIYISIAQGLLDTKHRKQMGTSVWEFMWCIDKMTRMNGLVLGGKPVNLKDLARQLGTSEVTTSRNLNRLKRQGYIKTKHTPYGIKIKVAKPKKLFNKKQEQPVEKFLSGIIRIVKAPFTNDAVDIRNDRANKTRQEDKKYDNYAPVEKRRPRKREYYPKLPIRPKVEFINTPEGRIARIAPLQHHP